MNKLLLETQLVDVALLEAKENAPLPEGVIARLKIGVAARAGQKTGNGRIYPESLMLRESKLLEAKSSSGLVMMNADHPTSLHNGAGAPICGPNGVAAILRKISFNESNGHLSLDEVDIVDTTAGRDVKAIIKAGGKLGVSTRGSGTGKPGKYKNSSGETLEGIIIQDDFCLESLDFCTNPSVTIARVDEIRENMEMPEDKHMLTLETLKKDHPDLVQQIQESAVENKKTELLETVSEKLSARENEIREELAQEWAEEKSTLESRVKELTTINESLKKDKELVTAGESEMLKDVKKQLSETKARLDKKEALEYVTENTKSHPHAAAIRERCKDVNTVAEAKTLLESTIKLLDDVGKNVKDLNGTDNTNGKGVVHEKDPNKDVVTESQNSEPTAKDKARVLAGLA